MYGIPKQKLNNSDKQRIQARFTSKIEAFIAKSPEELKILLTTKMSSTDKYALELVVDQKIKQNIAKIKEEELKINLEENDITGENQENSVTSNISAGAEVIDGA